jgi:hypothetical protein
MHTSEPRGSEYRELAGGHVPVIGKFRHYLSLHSRLGHFILGLLPDPLDVAVVPSLESGLERTGGTVTNLEESAGEGGWRLVSRPVG